MLDIGGDGGLIYARSLVDVLVWVFWLALIVLAIELVIRATRRQRCPHCRSWIDKRASVCPQCTQSIT